MKTATARRQMLTADEKVIQEPRRCLKHSINPASLMVDCSICAAYAEANGDFNKARRIFVKGRENFYGSPSSKHNSSAPVVEFNDLIFEYQEIA